MLQFCNVFVTKKYFLLHIYLTIYSLYIWRGIFCTVMLSEVKNKIQSAAAAYHAAAFFGFISEISKAIENDTKKGNTSFPAIFANEDITIDGHEITADCLFVAGADADEYSIYQTASEIVDFCGGDSCTTRFNVISDASLAFTRTFKNVNLQPLTAHKLKGVEFELKIYC